MSKTTFFQGLPSYVEGKYDTYFLIKFFQNEDNREYFLNGKLYMNTNMSFSKHEMGSERFDINEGADIVVVQRDSSSFVNVRFSKDNCGLRYEITESEDCPDHFKDNIAFISYPLENQHRNLFCMYTLWCNDANNTTNTIDYEKIKEFGEFGVVITDPYKFLKLIADAAETEESIKYVNCGFVNYVSMKNIMEMNPFLKPMDDYAHQNEFRICAQTDNSNLLELHLAHDLRSISKIIKLSDFVETVHYQNGQLIFKAEKP